MSNVTQDDLSRFQRMMDWIKDVLEGRDDPPGDAQCTFPYCRCQSPMKHCDLNSGDN